MTAQQIASELNELAYTRRAYAVSYSQGVGSRGYMPGDNPDMFPGWRLLSARRMDGQPWTAELVKSELKAR